MPADAHQLGPAAQSCLRDRPRTLPELWRHAQDHRHHPRGTGDRAHSQVPRLAGSGCHPRRRHAGRYGTRPDLGLIPHQAASASGRWDLLRPRLSEAGNGGAIIRVHPWMTPPMDPRGKLCAAQRDAVDSKGSAASLRCRAWLGHGPEKRMFEIPILSNVSKSAIEKFLIPNRLSVSRWAPPTPPRPAIATLA